MRTLVIITLLLAFSAPAAAEQAPQVEEIGAAFERVAREIEREFERAARQTQREREQSERERERLREQAERERERRERERQRAEEQAERQRERAREQAERDHERRDGRARETERFTRTLRVGPKGELHLTNIAGDIVISRGSGTDVHVEVIKTGRAATTEDARALLKLVDVDFTERPGRAEVSTRYPSGDELRRNNRRNADVSVAFNVSVPAATRLRVTSIAGDVSARDVSGDVVLKSVSGTVRFINGAGACTAESLSGDIDVSDSAFDGSLSASTASGNVTLTRIKARRVGLNSISGNLVLNDAAGPSVDAKTVSGNVDLKGGLMKSARYELGSHSGNLTVAIAGATGFEVQATSFSGSIRADVPFADRQAEARERFKRSLRGVVGDGSAVVNLTTFSGSIVITKR